MKAAQLMLCGNRAVIPRLSVRCIVRGDERERDTIRVVERDDGLAEPFGRTIDLDIVRFQSVAPVVERSFGNEVRRGPSLSVAKLPGTAALAPRKERDVRSRCSSAVAEIEVVGILIVVVDGLFDEPQTERFDVELGGALRIARDGGHVMKPRCSRRHYIVS